MVWAASTSYVVVGGCKGPRVLVAVVVVVVAQEESEFGWVWFLASPSSMAK